MFRRSWSSLPPDPTFEPDLLKLGYFINNMDEVRDIEEPRYYYKYFINKNDRWNERKRFAFHEAIEKIIRVRLEATGLKKIGLPFGAGPTEAHVPIFASSDLPRRSRVVVIIGESIQDVGVLAYRVATGPGGIDQGTVVSIAKLLSQQRSSASDPSPPGLVVANTGQLWWWPDGARALNQWSRDALPMPSAVHWGHRTEPSLNGVPGNRSVAEHVAYVFDKVLRKLAARDARVDVIGIMDGADVVEAYLDQEKNWEIWGPRLNTLTLLGGFYDATKANVPGFQQFLRDRARAYILSARPLGMPISGPGGVTPDNPEFTATLGCPVYGSGEPSHGELLMIKAKESVLDWIQEVALDPDYRNPEVTVTSLPGDGGGGGGDDELWGPETVIDEELAGEMEEHIGLHGDAESDKVQPQLEQK